MTQNGSAAGDSALNERISEWLRWDRNEETLREVKGLLEAKDFAALDRMLSKRLSFGTAGLRGRMGAGFAAMNDLVVIQTAQGLLRHLEAVEGGLLRRNGIIVGYDGRHNSRRFAELTAAVFVHHGHPVRLLGAVAPTPFIPFALREHACAAGVMVTASHNPKEDNGYKVYGPRGTQIISPTDKQIQAQILASLEPFESSWRTDVLDGSELVSDPLPHILKSYLGHIGAAVLPEHLKCNVHSDLVFTYSAMHGVGYKYVKAAFDLIGVKFVPVEEQKEPHPDFPTVKFPNPEEGKSSLDLSFRTANSHSSNVIIANDPDADRMAAAEKDQRTGQWRVFTGNELGALLGWWCLHCYKTKYPHDDLSDVYMLSSTVSSKILKTMAKYEGFNFVETLTGFKWIGSKIDELLVEKKKVIFAFEEAIGFMCGSTVLDKDGVSAACNIATLCTYLYQMGQTLHSKLDEIYKIYGFHITENSYFICHDQEKIVRIFDKIRNFTETNRYPSGILNNKYTISGIRDLTTGFDSSQPDKKAVLPVSKSSQMITFEFANGLVCTLRTSGTEPKIKYYTEMCADPSETDQTVIKDTLSEMINGILDEFLEPVCNELIPQTK